MRRFLHVLTWLSRLFLFLFIFLLALRNSEPVVVNLFFDQSWQAPLALLMLVMFAAGVLLGLLVMAGLLFSARRQAAQWRKKFAAAEKLVTPSPDSLRETQ